jgi:hypothetical protein
MSIVLSQVQRNLISSKLMGSEQRENREYSQASVYILCPQIMKLNT